MGRGPRTREFGEQVDDFRGGLAVARHRSAATTSPSSPNNRVEWAVAAYACFGLGAAFVPDVRGAARRRTGSSSSTTARPRSLIVANDAILEKTQGVPRDGPVAQAHHRPRRRRRTATATSRRTRRSSTTGKKVAVDQAGARRTPRCLIYTSGTTGNPKGVILSHGNIASNVNAVHEVFPMASDDRSLSFLPWAHSFGQTCELHVPLLVGASHGASARRRQDPRQPRRGEADAALQRAAHLQQASTTAVQKQIAEQARARAERSCKAALAMHGEAAQRASASRSREQLALALADKRRLLEGARALRRPAEVRVQRRRGALARRRRVHRQPRHHRLRGLRPHRDEPDRDGELARRAHDRQRRPADPRRDDRDRHDRPRPNDGKRGRDRRLRPQRHEGLPQPRRGERRGLHRGRRLPHRRPGLPRRRRLPLHHRPHQGAVQARERQVRRARRRSRSSSSSRRTSLNAMVYGDNKPFNVALVVRERRRA